MGNDVILFSIPGFFVLLGVEAAASAVLRKGFYRTADTLNDLSMGVLSQVMGVFAQAAVVAIYAWLYDRARLYAVPHTALGWALAFVAWDFFYYWSHRSMHEINVLWATHSPHHQSEEYNLAVALRQGAFQSTLTCFFFWPMALAGVDVAMYLTVAGLNLVYQFWIHTRFIRTLGPLELVFNTPSHHRVHHGKNFKYLDRNHGGVFIVWDKLFGTFHREEEEPVYGTLDPLASWNPAWGQVKFFAYLGRAAARSRNRWDLVRIWFAPAGWVPPNTVEPVALDAPISPKYDPPVTRGRKRYALAMFTATVALALVFLAKAPVLSLGASVALAVQVVLGLTGVGAVLDAKPWAQWFEPARLASLLTTALVWMVF